MSTQHLDAQDVPPVGEEIHLPGPSILPLINAVGFSMILVGLGLSLWISYAGIAVFVVTAAFWIRDTVTEIRHLPEHHHH